MREGSGKINFRLCIKALNMKNGYVIVWDVYNYIVKFEYQFVSKTDNRHQTTISVIAEYSVQMNPQHILWFSYLQNILEQKSYLRLTVKYPVFEGDTAVPTASFTVQVYNPSSFLLRLVMVKVEVARPTALGLVIATLPPCVMISEPFFHVTVAFGFPSY